MKKILLFALLLLSITSCYNEPQKKTRKNGIQLELLFINEGCKVYRFFDGGRAVYYSDCSGKIEYTYREGKHDKNRETLNN